VQQLMLFRVPERRPPPEPLPTNVWPCAQVQARMQRRGRYVPASNIHPAKMLPEMARRIVETYSSPGDLVLDPMAGIGTTLVEAGHLGRRALGVEYEAKFVALARESLAFARAQGAPGTMECRQGDARVLDGVPQADLVVFSPPYGNRIEGRNMTIAERVQRMRAKGKEPTRWWLHRSPEALARPQRGYSKDRDNLGNIPAGPLYLAEMLKVYHRCWRVLRPGGYMVVAVKSFRQDGAQVFLAGNTVNLCQQAGFVFHQHIIALLCGVGQSAALTPRASIWEMLRVRQSQRTDEPVLLGQHEDVLVFRRPGQRETDETT